MPQRTNKIFKKLNKYNTCMYVRPLSSFWFETVYSPLILIIFFCVDKKQAVLSSPSPSMAEIRSFLYSSCFEPLSSTLSFLLSMSFWQTKLHLIGCMAPFLDICPFTLNYMSEPFRPAFSIPPTRVVTNIWHRLMSFVVRKYYYWPSFFQILVFRCCL